MPEKEKKQNTEPKKKIGDNAYRFLWKENLILFQTYKYLREKLLKEYQRQFQRSRK
jgi:hypothetical protein